MPARWRTPGPPRSERPSPPGSRGPSCPRPRTRAVGSGRQPAAGGQVRSAGADAGLARELLRALGRELGIPGAPEGPDHRRRRRAGRALRGRRDAVDLGLGRPGRLRRIRPGHAPPGHRAHSRRRGTAPDQAGPRADCATSNSPSSCCSSCTASPTNRCAAGTPPRPSPRCPPAATSAARTPRNSTATTATCGCSSTGSSCSSCAAPTSCRSRKRRCAPSPRPSWDRSPPSGPTRTPWWPPGRRPSAPSANCTSAFSTGRCSTPPPR